MYVHFNHKHVKTSDGTKEMPEAPVRQQLRRDIESRVNSNLYSYSTPNTIKSFHLIIPVITIIIISR